MNQLDKSSERLAEIKKRWSNTKAPWRNTLDLVGQPCIMDNDFNVVADAYGDNIWPISCAAQDVEWLINKIEALQYLIKDVK